MSSESQPEAKRQRIEEQDDHLTTTKTDRKMAEETSKMETEATAEGEFQLLDRSDTCIAVCTCHFWRMNMRHEAEVWRSGVGLPVPADLGAGVQYWRSLCSVPWPSDVRFGGLVFAYCKEQMADRRVAIAFGWVADWRIGSIHARRPHTCTQRC